MKGLFRNECTVTDTNHLGSSKYATSLSQRLPTYAHVDSLDGDVAVLLDDALSTFQELGAGLRLPPFPKISFRVELTALRD